jgi:hypothetical protein
VWQDIGGSFIIRIATTYLHPESDDLESWMTAAEETGEPALRSSVTGHRGDQEAVTQGPAKVSASLCIEFAADRYRDTFRIP